MQVKFFASLRSITGELNIEVNGVANVRGLITILLEKYKNLKEIILDSEGNLNKGYIILVNGENIYYLNGFDTPLNDNDVVSIFPPIGGG